MLALVVAIVVSVDGGAPDGGPPVFTGKLDKELIRRVIHDHRSELRACYEEGRARKSNLDGKAVVAFDIGPRGSVDACEVKYSTVDDLKVEQCMAGAVRNWRFPKPQGGTVHVEYPFRLSLK